ncbi:MAG: fused MFS/spermidine synthase, partial [Bacteroidales bacterium]
LVWLRTIQLVFGVHVYSTSAVLTAFMAGLATGSYLFGKWVDRIQNPINLYLIIEAGIFLYAISFSFLFDFSSNLYLEHFSGSLKGNDPGNIIKFFQAFIILIIPTTLMGGTIPVVTKILIRSLNKLGRELSLIYSLNNLGAAVGGIAAGFFFIRLLGMKETMYLAAALNLVNTVVIYLLRKQGRFFGQEKMDRIKNGGEEGRKYSTLFLRIILIVFAVEGFTTLAYEILWTRIFIEFSYDKTVYIYSVIVVGFIFGLSLGSFIIRNLVNRLRDLPVFLAISQVGIGLLSFLLLMLFIYLSPILVQNRGFEGSWFSVSGKEYLLIFGLLTLPVTLMGFTFPLVGKIVSENISTLGSTIGLVGFLDTAGSIFGAYAAGFILIPLLGIYPSFLVIVYMNISLGVLLLLTHPEKGSRRRVAILISIVSLILLFFVPGNQEYFKQRVKYYPGDEVVSYAEGVSATVSVHRMPSGHKALAINGSKTAFSTSADLKVHTMLAYTPYLLSGGNDTAFIIGYGMGVTAKCLADAPLKLIDIAEISPEVVSTSDQSFSFLNFNVSKDPKVNIYFEDGRSFLLRSPRKYGLITSNAVHARLGANLYTREFYEICDSKLTEDGFMCQWLPTNWLSSNEFKALVKSFTEVFPNSSLWYVTRGHMLLLGSRSDKKVDFTKLENKFHNRGVFNNLMEAGLLSAEEFASHLMATDRPLVKFVKDSKINTDNHPLVEFSMVTDLRPNIEILEEISSIKMQDQYNSFFIFSEDKKKFSSREQLIYLNNTLREEILNFTSIHK